VWHGIYLVTNGEAWLNTTVPIGVIVGVTMTFMPRINPAIAFGRNARQALTYYQEALGGKLSFTTYRDWVNTGDPDGDLVPAGDMELLVAGALLTDAGQRISAADMGEDITAPGSGLSLELNGTPEEVDYVRNAYEKLADGGVVETPFGKASWADDEYWGALTDKFGIHWEFGIHPNSRYL
jgi:PhnB protein